MKSSSRPRSLGRRKLLAGAAGSLAVASLARTVDAAAPAIENDSRGDGVHRLEAIARKLEQLDDRLEDVAGVLINPSDPDKPAIRAAIADLKTACANIDATADDLLARL